VAAAAASAFWATGVDGAEHRARLLRVLAASPYDRAPETLVVARSGSGVTAAAELYAEPA